MNPGRTATLVAAVGLALVVGTLPLVVGAQSNEALFWALGFSFLAAAATTVVSARIAVWRGTTGWDRVARVLIVLLGFLALLALFVFVSFGCFEGPSACAPRET